MSNYIIEFHDDTFLRHNAYSLPISANSLEGLVLQFKAQLRCKADAAHHSQRIVREGYIRVARGTNYTILKVVHTVKWVDKFAKSLAIKAPRHSVDCKVSTTLVVLDCSILYMRLTRVGRV